MIQPSTTLNVVQGAALLATSGFTFSGSPPVTFAGADTLSGTVWLAQNEAPLLYFTPTWVNAATCQLTISLLAAQTLTLPIDTVYNLQVFATQSSTTYCVAWLYLQVLPAAGAQAGPAIPDLITGSYASQMLAAIRLTPAQLEQVPNLITSASYALRAWCNRRFDQGIRIEQCAVTLDGQIRLKSPPINQILRIQGSPATVLTITNPSTSVQIARAYFAVTGDVASGQTITGMTLTWVSNGVPSTATITYSANETVSSLASAIGAVGSGWVATTNTVNGAWPVTELQGGLIGQGCTTGDGTGAGATFQVFASDLDYAQWNVDDGQRTGIVWTGRQYNDLTPRWGPGWDDQGSEGAYTGLVQVTYNGGFATIPPQIQLGCVELVKMQLERMRKDLLFSSEAAGQYSYVISPEMVNALPRNVLTGVAGHKIHNA